MSSELPDLDAVIGQDRARTAVELGIEMPQQGYHLFVMGPPGSGKKALVRTAIEARRASVPAARNDWVYVNNFVQSHCPLAIALPPGRGSELRADLRRLVDDLQATIPAVFESEEYTSQSERIGADINERGSKALKVVVDEANSRGIAMIHTPSGFTFAPQKDGEVTPPEEFEKLPDEEKERIARTIEALQEQLVRVLRNTLKLRQEHSERIRALNRKMTLLAVEHAVDELKARYSDLPRVLDYLDAVQSDVIDNADDFRRREGESEGEPAKASELHRYVVNVLIDAGSETPVVFEDLPSYQNLVGRIDHVARFGTLMTDFTLIQPGTLHRANGGYLLIDALKLLTQPFAWAAIKRALQRCEVRIESMAEMYSIVSTVRLEPEPIPLQVKLVLFGDRELYELLLHFDPEFGELFRIVADLSEDLARDASMESQLARVLATQARRKGLLPLQANALARLIDQGARLAGDSRKLTARVQALIDLAVEADHAARAAGAPSVEGAHVVAAVAAQRRRAARLHERVQEAMVRGTLLIDTAGTRIGQVNALAVYEAAGMPFGEPMRVTATTRFGEGQVVDVQRETELGGAIHSKGVLILSAFLAARYSEFSPHSIVASLVFEQTYGRVEGDSASLAEVVALMSSLAEAPVRQSLAVTGSVNQLGRVQAVGAVNEKIEGFFDLCAERGLDGSHGVVIPAANTEHLMLRDDVVDAVTAGRFAVHAVETVDQAIGLLTGIPAGAAEPPWDDASINGRIARRLREYAALRRGEHRFGPKS
ncbi:MAG TPA: ATP-binding protein, partial [Burkholderiaceae bacterium]|nr:ATP-binding protein [Burkholderiaceae bacterium]